MRLFSVTRYLFATAALALLLTSRTLLASEDPCEFKEICLAVRISVLAKDSPPPGEAVILPQDIVQVDAEKVLTDATRFWAQCGIGFRLDSYRVLDPAHFPVQLPLRDPRQLVQLAWVLPSPSALEVVATPRWTGDLSGERLSRRLAVAINSVEVNTHSAWSPVIFMNEGFANRGDVLAHELGHALGLVHRDSMDREKKHFKPGLMYPNSPGAGKTLRMTEDECRIARETARTRHWAALR